MTTTSPSFTPPQVARSTSCLLFYRSNKSSDSCASLLVAFGDLHRARSPRRTHPMLRIHPSSPTSTLPPTLLSSLPSQQAGWKTPPFTPLSSSAFWWGVQTTGRWGHSWVCPKHLRVLDVEEVKSSLSYGVCFGRELLILKREGRRDGEGGREERGVGFVIR